MTRRNDKRPRLIEAADTLFLQQGVNTTTLADIASLAKVPLGNVYYYFKSKEAIVLAVLQRRREQLKERLNQISATYQEPRSRLAACLGLSEPETEQVVAYGDHLGSLCQELAKQPSGTVSQAAAELMTEFATWVQAQYAAMGAAHPEARAHRFLATLLGSKLLTLSFKNADVLATQNELLKDELMSA